MWTKTFIGLSALVLLLIPYIVWWRHRFKEKKKTRDISIKAAKQRVEELIALARRANQRGDTETWSGFLLQAQVQLDLLQNLGGKNTLAWVEDKAHEVQTCQQGKGSQPASALPVLVKAPRLELITPLSEEDLFDGGQWLTIDRTLRCQQALDFEQRLAALVVGQPGGVKALADAYLMYLMGASAPGHTIGNLLFLGPTGSGKTRIVEASSLLLTGSEKRFVKIDCSEFQENHEVAKLIGSPPGYKGHRETEPRLTQKVIDACQTDDCKMTFVLFDEIEKASPALWTLLLGILDKATLTLGDNTTVNFERCCIVLTSNLGAREMTGDGQIGFDMPASLTTVQIGKIGNKAARKRFDPEFFNRLDEVVAFGQLNPDMLLQILRLELAAIELRFQGQFQLLLTRKAQDLLIRQGYDLRYGARHLKRVLQRNLCVALANMKATLPGGFYPIGVGVDSTASELVFKRRNA